MRTISKEVLELAMKALFGKDLKVMKSLIIERGIATIEYWPEGRGGDLITRRYKVEQEESDETKGNNYNW